MRLSLFAALLSTVLMPVAANAQDHRDRDGRDRGSIARADRPHVPRAHDPRADARADRGVRPAITHREPRVDVPARAERQHRATRPIRRVDPNAFRQDRDRASAAAQQRADDRQHRRDGEGRRARDDRNPRWDRNDRGDRDHRLDRNDRQDREHRWNRNDRADRDQWGRSDRWDQGRWDQGRWDRDRSDRHDRFDRRWRDDHRYDWRDYRARHRSTFHLPRYYAPHSWSYGYRRFSVGFRLDSLLFGSSYWIADPYYYRLPPAYGPYRWVRYYDDALLVDVRTGEVIDVVYDIFW